MNNQYATKPNQITVENWQEKYDQGFRWQENVDSWYEHRITLSEWLGKKEEIIGKGNVLLGLPANEQGVPDVFASTVEPILQDFMAKGQDWLGQNISGLASGKPNNEIKPDEVLAEAVAEYQLNKEPREAAKELGAAIDAAYQQAHPKADTVS